MMKYSQDKDESFVETQFLKDHGEHTKSKTCKTIDSVWDILDMGLADRRKLVNE